MNIEKRVSTGNSESNIVRKIGISNWEVLSINPDKSQLVKLLNIGDDGAEKMKDKEYLGETKDGDTKLTLSIWMKSEDGFILPLQFNLVDKLVVSKSNKHQYINQIGDSAWVDDESNLQERFTKFTNKEKVVVGDKNYRQAHEGEAQLMEFLKNWIKADYFNPATDILLDWKKLMRGNVSELTSLVNTDSVQEVIAAAEVRVVDSEDGQKVYNSIYPRAFAPAYKMKIFRNAIANGTAANSSDYTTKKFYNDLCGEYGSKNITVMELLKDYNPEEHMAASDSTFSNPDDASY